MFDSRLTLCSFQLLYGKLYTELPSKWVLFSAVFLLEVGAIVAATAPTSLAVILGRALAGLGSAGILSGYAM
jgi:MFS family permease